MNMSGFRAVSTISGEDVSVSGGMTEAESKDSGWRETVIDPVGKKGERRDSMPDEKEGADD